MERGKLMDGKFHNKIEEVKVPIIQHIFFFPVLCRRILDSENNLPPSEWAKQLLQQIF